MCEAAKHLREIVEALPEGASVSLRRETLQAWLEAAPREERPEPAPEAPEPASWRERLWTVPAETRLDVEAVAEALGRPKSAVYKLTSAGEIPHRKLSGTPVFVAEELRSWVRDQEEVLVPGSEGRRRVLGLAD